MSADSISGPGGLKVQFHITAVDGSGLSLSPGSSYCVTSTVRQLQNNMIQLVDLAED